MDTSSTRPSTEISYSDDKKTIPKENMKRKHFGTILNFLIKKSYILFAKFIEANILGCWIDVQTDIGIKFSS